MLIDRHAQVAETGSGHQYFSELGCSTSGVVHVCDQWFLSLGTDRQELREIRQKEGYTDTPRSGGCIEAL